MPVSGATKPSAQLKASTPFGQYLPFSHVTQLSLFQYIPGVQGTRSEEVVLKHS